MAGPSLGDASPLSPAPGTSPTRHLVLASSRTRRMHGVFCLGRELAAVYSTRRECDGFGVALSVGSSEPGSMTFTGRMTSTQARAMARALSAAADAAELQRQGGEA